LSYSGITETDPVSYSATRSVSISTRISSISSMLTNNYTWPDVALAMN